MDFIRFCLSLIFLTFVACSPEQKPEELVQVGNLDDGIFKVLMIGNSHTFYNNIPNQVETILASVLDDEVKVSSATGGGLAFVDHATLESTQTSIQLENWDWVVLQENGGYASFPDARAKEEVYPFARSLKKNILDNNIDSQILLYMTHGYFGGASWCDEDPNVCDYISMQEQIRRNYLRLGEILDVSIAPAGMMWRILIASKEYDLWNADTIHPSEKGSAISALTIAAMLLNELVSVENLKYGDFTMEEAEDIISILNSSMFENNPDWKVF